MYKFVLKDKGTDNEGWWLEISTIDEYIKYLEDSSPTIFEDVFQDYINNKHHKPLTEAIKLYGNKNNLPFLSAFNGFRIGVVSNQIKSLEETGKIYINPVGGYHGAYNEEDGYDFIIKDNLSFPNEKDVNNIIETANDSLKENYGFLTPLGEFIKGDWGEHEKLAYEIIKKNKWYEEWKKYYSNTEYSFYYYGDFLVNIKGYILIHNPSNFDIKVTSYKPLTKKQKEFLYDYFYNLGMIDKANLYMEE